MRKEAKINKYTLFDKVQYTPHSKEQWDIHKSTARFRIPCCGRRFGKSMCAGHEMTAAMFIPDSYYWICGPTYKLGEKEFRVVFDDMIRKLKLGKEIKKSYNVKQGDMRIEMPWNTILEVVSAEKQDSLTGEGLDGVIVSEAAQHKRSTWEQYLEPALSDKRGWAIFPSTPRGFNWYQGLWQLGQQEEFPQYDSWQMPTWTNKAMYPGGVDDEEIQRIRMRVSEQYFRQEYAAEFTTFAGQIYDEFDPKIHVKHIEYNPLWRNYLVFDYGFTDPFVCLDIMVGPMDTVYVWREYQVRYKTTYEHGLTIKERENPEGYHVDCMFGDPRGADESATLAMIIGPVWGRVVPWLQGIEAVKRALKLKPDGSAGMYIDPSCVELIRQMQNLRRNEPKEDRNAKEGQHDYDDHGPDALRYFCSEYFVLGAGASLSDIYPSGYRGSEAETFFQDYGGLVLDDRIEF